MLVTLHRVLYLHSELILLSFQCHNMNETSCLFWRVVVNIIWDKTKASKYGQRLQSSWNYRNCAVWICFRQIVFSVLSCYNYRVTSDIKSVRDLYIYHKIFTYDFQHDSTRSPTGDSCFDALLVTFRYFQVVIFVMFDDRKCISSLEVSFLHFTRYMGLITSAQILSPKNQPCL